MNIDLRWCVALLVLAGVAPGPATAADSMIVQVFDAVPAASREALYVGNRAPLATSPLVKLPIGSIKPRGWLRGQLELEADGITGHLEEVSHWCQFDGNAWTSPNGTGQNAWEEVPYWLKGYGDLGYVLHDEKIIREARRWIDAVLASQEADGYFGPRANKTGLDGQPDLWPHMVMLNVLQSFYEYSGDGRVLPFMLKYHQWLNSLPPAAFGRGYWPKMRFGDNEETAYWLYNRTGAPWLLDLATKIHKNMQDWSTGVHDRHNVNIAQAFREPTIYFQQALTKDFLQGAERNYHQVMDVYGQFPGGGFAADENERVGHTDPHQGFETCGMVEFMHSFEMLTKITGLSQWSDRAEEIAFNSLPAAITADWKGLHYLTCPNQVQLDRTNHSPGIQNGGTMFSYSPGEVYRCCQHNVSHGWPYYTEELWLGTADRGLCASLYSASEVSAKVGLEGATVKISEETEYPFSETVSYQIAAEAAVKFPLYLRLPDWCERPVVAVNGQAVQFPIQSGGYLSIYREWKSGDKLTLQLPMQVSVQRWSKNHDAASVSYGPLSFSAKIGEKWTRYGGTDAWPEYEVFPTTPWNYGLVLGNNAPARAFSVIRDHGPLASNPFTPASVPIQLRVDAKKIAAWGMDQNGLVGELQSSPVKSLDPVETITLIPMGAARLRISMFPVVGDGADARPWTLAN